MNRLERRAAGMRGPAPAPSAPAPIDPDVWLHAIEAHPRTDDADVAVAKQLLGTDRFYAAASAASEKELKDGVWKLVDTGFLGEAEVTDLNSGLEEFEYRLTFPHAP